MPIERRAVKVWDDDGIHQHIEHHLYDTDKGRFISGEYDYGYSSSTPSYDIKLMAREYFAKRYPTNPKYVKDQDYWDRHASRAKKTLDEINNYFINNGRYTPKAGSATISIALINQKFPSAAGWVIQPGEYLSESIASINGGLNAGNPLLGGGIEETGYVSLKAINKVTGEVQLIDLDTTVARKARDTAYLARLQAMYENSHPEEKVTGTWRLTTSTSATQPWLHGDGASQARLDNIYGNGVLKKNIVNLDKEELKKVHLDDTNRFFKKATPDDILFGTHTQIDAETDNFGNVISVSAKKFGFKKDTGELVLVDTLEKYYYGNEKGLGAGSAQATHGYSLKHIGKLQRLAGQHIGTKFDAKAQAELTKFVGKSILVGHNIDGVDGDIKWLFGKNADQMRANGVIDTFQLARAYRQPGVNSAETLFAAAYGQTSSQYGLHHHWAGSDTTQQELIFTSMLKAPNALGKATRTLLLNPGWRIHPAEYVGSSGSYNIGYLEQAYENFTTGRRSTLNDLSGSTEARVSGWKLPKAFTTIEGSIQAIDENLVSPETIQQLQRVSLSTNSEYIVPVRGGNVMNNEPLGLETLNNAAAALLATGKQASGLMGSLGDTIKDIAGLSGINKISGIEKMFSQLAHSGVRTKEEAEAFIVSRGGSKDLANRVASSYQNVVNEPKFQKAILRHDTQIAGTAIPTGFSARYGFERDSLYDRAQAIGTASANNVLSSVATLPKVSSNIEASGGYGSLGGRYTALESLQSLKAAKTQLDAISDARFGSIKSMAQELNSRPEVFDRNNGFKQFYKSYSDWERSNSITQLAQELNSRPEVFDRNNGFKQFYKSYSGWERSNNKERTTVPQGIAQLAQELNAEPEVFDRNNFGRWKEARELDEAISARMAGEARPAAQLKQSMDMYDSHFGGRDTFGSAISTFAKAADKFGKSVGAMMEGVEKIFGYEPGRFESEGLAAAKQINRAGGAAFGKYWAPFGHLTSVVQDDLAFEKYEKERKAGVPKGVGSILTEAGKAVGGPWGGALQAAGGLTSTVGTWVATGETPWTQRRNRNILAGVQHEVTHNFDLLGFVLEPLKLAAGIFSKIPNIALKIWNYFQKGMGYLQNLGNPLTGLTGVNYEGYQRTTMADRMVGLSRGSTNSTYEGFAQAQANLFTLGQLDTNRLVSAALLGSFGDIYSNGGDTEAQYGRTVENVASQVAQGGMTARNALAYANNIDKEMAGKAQMLARMREYTGNANLTYKQMNSPETFGGYYYGLQDKQMGQLYGARNTWGSAVESFQNVLMKSAVGIWDNWGKQMSKGLMGQLNNIADSLLQGDFAGAWDKLKGMLSDGWEKIKELLDNGDLGDKIKSSLAGIWNAISPVLAEIAQKILPVITTIGHTIYDIFYNTLEQIVGASGRLWSTLSDIQLDPIALLPESIRSQIDPKGKHSRFISSKTVNEMLSEPSHALWNVTTVEQMNSYGQHEKTLIPSDARNLYQRNGTDWALPANAQLVLADDPNAQKLVSNLEMVGGHLNLEAANRWAKNSDMSQVLNWASEKIMEGGDINDLATKLYSAGRNIAKTDKGVANWVQMFKEVFGIDIENARSTDVTNPLVSGLQGMHKMSNQVFDEILKTVGGSLQPQKLQIDVTSTVEDGRIKTETTVDGVPIGSGEAKNGRSNVAHWTFTNAFANTVATLSQAAAVD